MHCCHERADIYSVLVRLGDTWRGRCLNHKSKMTIEMSNAPAAPPPEVQELVAAPKRRHPWVVLAAIVLFVIVAAGGASLFVTSGNRESTNDTYVEGRIIRISPKVSGQVISLRVDDNDALKAGELLLEIDPVDYQAKEDQAVAADMDPATVTVATPFALLQAAGVRVHAQQ